MATLTSAQVMTATDALVAAGKQSGVNFITIRPGEGFFTYLEVALVIGAALVARALGGQVGVRE